MASEEDNNVHLRGRVSAVDEPRELPSGDAVVTLRVVIARPRRAATSTTRAGDSRGSGTSRPAKTVVDTIDVACWSARTRRTAGTLTPDDTVEVDGALRRRFFRAGGAAASRYEVEAHRIKRVPA
jgi:single-strand DNA-binding protein